MKILFFTSETNDYMEDCLLHGLRQILDSDLIDYPKKKHMYKEQNNQKSIVHGLGFTLPGLLPDIDIDRSNVIEKIRNNYFDYIIFPCIYRQYDIFADLHQNLIPEKTIFVDGSDSTRHLAELTFYIKKTFKFKSPRIFKQSHYFKRELTKRTYIRFPDNFFGKVLNIFFPTDRSNIKSITFGIPEEKIINKFPIKSKLWPTHIVDNEISQEVSGSYSTYAFDNEKDYYSDLQNAKYGITTKRAGWDCMRHYEIAANGAVICFKNLNEKPKSCAPHDLIPGVNCISYNSFPDLKNKINNLSPQKYSKIQAGGLDWVRNKTTRDIASKLLNDIGAK